MKCYNIRFEGYILYDIDKGFLHHSYSGWKWSHVFHTAKIYKNKKSAYSRADIQKCEVVSIELTTKFNK